MGQASSRSSDRVQALLTRQDLIVRMCRHGARVSVMRDLLPEDISTRAVLDIFRQVTGSFPKQGQLPQSLGTLFRTPGYRLQASVAVCKFERIGEAEPDFAERYMSAYEAYRRTFAENAVFDFNRVWFLLRQYTIGRCRMTKCVSCSSTYVYLTEDVSDRYKCPVCWYRQRSGALTAGRNGNPLAKPLPTAVEPSRERARKQANHLAVAASRAQLPLAL